MQTLGLMLLERTYRRVALTLAGNVFLTEYRQILSNVEQEIRATQSVTQDTAGQLILGFEWNALQRLLGFVASGLEITLLPKSSRLEQTGIVYRPIQPPAPKEQLAISWNQKSPVVDSFLQVVEACHGDELVFQHVIK